MSAFIRRFATPLIIGFFAISLISGVALFFHWQQGTFHEMHEWLSMVLIVPFLLHLARNWSSVTSYFRKWPVALALVLAVALAVPFALGEGGRGPEGNPTFRLMPLVAQAPISALAPVLKTTPDALAQTLRAKGYQVASATQSLTDVAKASHAEFPAVLRAALPPGGVAR